MMLMKTSMTMGLVCPEHRRMRSKKAITGCKTSNSRSKEVKRKTIRTQLSRTQRRSIVIAIQCMYAVLTNFRQRLLSWTLRLDFHAVVASEKRPTWSVQPSLVGGVELPGRKGVFNLSAKEILSENGPGNYWPFVVSIIQLNSMCECVKYDIVSSPYNFFLQCKMSASAECQQTTTTTKD